MERAHKRSTSKKRIITYQEILFRFVNTVSVDKQLLYEMDSYPEYGVSLEDTYLFCDDIFPIPYNSYYQSLFSYDDSFYLGSLCTTIGVIVQRSKTIQKKGQQFQRSPANYLPLQRAICIKPKCAGTSWIRVGVSTVESASLPIVKQS